MIPQGGEQMYIGQDQSWDEDPEAPAKSAKSPAILLVYFYSKQQGTKGLTHIFSTWIGTPATARINQYRISTYHLNGIR